jgi:hypothetical protein
MNPRAGTGLLGSEERLFDAQAGLLYNEYLFNRVARLNQDALVHGKFVVADLVCPEVCFA